MDFTNILLEAFTRADPKSVKNTDDLTVFFALLESAQIKALGKTLLKLTPDPVLGDGAAHVVDAVQHAPDVPGCLRTVLHLSIKKENK